MRGADDSAGVEHALPIGTVLGLGGWAPTTAVLTVVNLLAIAQTTAPQGRFGFPPVGLADWAVDDVYVDPVRTG